MSHSRYLSKRIHFYIQMLKMHKILFCKLINKLEISDSFQLEILETFKFSKPIKTSS